MTSDPSAQPAGIAHPDLPDWRTPVLSTAAAALILLGALSGLPWLWLPVVLLQLALVVTWHRSLGVPAAATGAVVGGGLALIADVAVVMSDDSPSLGPVAVVLGAGYLVAVVQQLVRRDGRERLVDSLAATVALATLASLGAGWVVLEQAPEADSAAVVLASACVAAALGRLAPGAAGAAVVPLVAGAAGGWLIGAAAADAWLGLGLGVAAGVSAALAATIEFRAGGRGSGWVVSSLWPVLFAGPLGYIALRLVA